MKQAFQTIKIMKSVMPHDVWHVYRVSTDKHCLSAVMGLEGLKA